MGPTGTLQSDIDANAAATQKLTSLISDVGTEVSAQNNLITQQAQQIATLQAQGSPVTAAQLSELEASTAGLIAGGTTLAGMVPNVAPPIAPTSASTPAPPATK